MFHFIPARLQIIGQSFELANLILGIGVPRTQRLLLTQALLTRLYPKLMPKVSTEHIKFRRSHVHHLDRGSIFRYPE